MIPLVLFLARQMGACFAGCSHRIQPSASADELKASGYRWENISASNRAIALKRRQFPSNKSFQPQIMQDAGQWIPSKKTSPGFQKNNWAALPYSNRLPSMNGSL